MSDRPHILLVLIDDFGWANAGWHRNYTAPGGSFVPATAEVATPHMNRLVRSGIELDRSYAYKYCSPSRSALQVGRDPYHVNVLNAEPSVTNRSDREAGFAGIPRSMTGIASKLAAAGYATAAFGKWDAGMAIHEQTPRGRGYQRALSYFHHLNDEWSTSVWQQPCRRGNSTVPIVDLWLSPGAQAAERPARGYNSSCLGDQPVGGHPKACTPGPHGDHAWDGFEDAMLAQQAIATVEQHDPSVPLFLFWAPHAVHTPLQVPQPYVDRFAFMAPTDKAAHERQLYAATVAFFDESFANLTNAYVRRRMYDQLLIVTSADNGGPVYYGGFGGANNHPLKGGKMNNWEGGIRVSAFVSGGHVPLVRRGTRYHGLVALWDWYATFCALARVDPTDERAKAAGLPPIDSIDQSAALFGASSTVRPPRTELALSTEPRQSDLAGAPECTSFSAVATYHDARIFGDEPAVLPQNGTCATLNGLIVADADGRGLWKLLLGDVEQAFVTGPYFPNASTPPSIPPAVAHCGSGCLYDLQSDPLEATDVAKRWPKRVASMRARLQTLLPSAFNPHRGTVDPACCEAALGRYGGFFGPFM